MAWARLTECQGAWVQTDCIEDVSPSRDNVLCLASQFNRLGLSPGALPGRGAGQHQRVRAA